MTRAFVDAPPLRRGKQARPFWDTYPLPRPGVRTRLLTILEKRYPCRKVPTGVARQLAAELGVSSSRVKVLLTDLGWVIASRNARIAGYACACGVPVRRFDFCKDCKVTAIPCAACGGPVRTRISELLRQAQRPPVAMPNGSPAEYTGRKFCDRACLARWMTHRRLERKPAA